MRFLFFLFTMSFAAAAAETEIHRYLYITSPDGAQNEGASGKGILVFDIDNGHQFVRRIDISSFGEGVRGFTGCTATKCAYFGTTNHRLGCVNLETDKVVWEKTYAAGCDRSCITPDGKTLYTPSGWWWRTAESGFLVIDPENGNLRKTIPIGPAAHNSIASLDGKYVYLVTETKLTMCNAADGSIVREVTPVGESGVFPFTVDSTNRTAYVCLGQHVGFDVVDLQEGKVLHRVTAGTAPIVHRTHGAALTPDETELWISDQIGKKLFIFDATQMPPKEKGQVELSAGGHGWVCFSLDGAIAWCHTPDVFDARTKQKIATLKDESGKPVSSSKFLEVHIRDGKVVRIGCEFGLGRKALEK